MLRQLLFVAMAFVLANTSFADHGIKAINGHTMELDGDKVKEMHEEGLGATAIAKALGIGRASVYRLLSQQ